MRVARVCRVIQIYSSLFAGDTNKAIVFNGKLGIRIGQTPVSCVHVAHIDVEEAVIGAALVSCVEAEAARAAFGIARLHVEIVCRAFAAVLFGHVRLALAIAGQRVAYLLKCAFAHTIAHVALGIREVAVLALAALARVVVGEAFFAEAFAGGGVAEGFTLRVPQNMFAPTIAFRAAGVRELPMIGQTRVASLAAHARLALTLAAQLVALRRHRADRIARTRLTTLEFAALALNTAQTPRVRRTLVAPFAHHVRLALALARPALTLGRAALVARATVALAIRSGRLSVVPRRANFTTIARRVVLALETLAASLIARFRVAHFYVLVALARLAFAVGFSWIAVVARRALLAGFASVAGAA